MPTTRRNRGFTLIEAMAASMILAFCVVAIGGAVTASNHASASADDMAGALSVARADMEVLASHKLSGLVASSEGTQQIDLGEKGGVESPRAASSATVTPVSRSPQQTPGDIAIVTVQAQAPSGQAVTVYRVVTTEGNGQ